MTYSVLHGNIIKLSLDKLEAQKIFGTFYGDKNKLPKSRIALKLLLKKALKDLEFSAQGDFSAQMTRNLAGGLDIYFRKCFSAAQKSQAENQHCALFFESCAEALKTAKAIKTELGAPKTSRFFRTEEGYCLVFEKVFSSEMHRFAEEFSNCLSHGDVECAKFMEYGKELISANAVSVLADLY